MKKIITLLFFMSFISFSYGQGLEMYSIISTDKKATVGDLYVNGSVNVKGPLYLGVPFKSGDSLRPSQKQSLTVKDFNISKLYSGRDVLFSSAVPNFDSVSVNSGSLYVNTSNEINSVASDIFRAKTISNTNATNVSLSSNMMNRQVSGKQIALNAGNIIFDSPFEKGSEIHTATPITPGIASNYFSYIYYPWEGLSKTVPSLETTIYGEICNDEINNLCKEGGEGRCKKCEENQPFCHDIRSLKLPAVFDANGANYTKVGSIKFYCRLNNVNNQCQKYMVAAIGSDTPEYREEFIDQGWSFPGSIDSTSNIGEGLKSPAEKCFDMCNSNSSGCSAGQDFYFAVDTRIGNVIDLDDEYTSDNLCGGATTNWSAGSGLECQAKELDVDIYKLTCYKNSGRIRRDNDTYYQYRRVDCNNPSVEEEFNVEDYTSNSFIYTDFPKTQNL